MTWVDLRVRGAGRSGVRHGDWEQPAAHLYDDAFLLRNSQVGVVPGKAPSTLDRDA
jgi:hypothetical protein